MSIMQDRVWEYHHGWSYEANLHSWTEAANFERKQYGERLLSHQEAHMKFAELYGTESEYGET